MKVAPVPTLVAVVVLLGIVIVAHATANAKETELKSVESHAESAFAKQAAAINVLKSTAKKNSAIAKEKLNAAKQERILAAKDKLSALKHSKESAQLQSQVKRNLEVAKEARLEQQELKLNKELSTASAQVQKARKTEQSAADAMIMAEQNLKAQKKAISDAKTDAAALETHAEKLKREAARAETRGHIAQKTGQHDREVAKTAQLQLAKLAKSAQAFNLKAKKLLADAKRIQKKTREQQHQAEREKRAAARANVASKVFKDKAHSMLDRLANLAERANSHEGKEADARANIEVIKNTVKRRKEALADALKAEQSSLARLSAAQHNVKLYSSSS